MQSNSKSYVWADWWWVQFSGFSRLVRQRNTCQQQCSQSSHPLRLLQRPSSLHSDWITQHCLLMNQHASKWNVIQFLCLFLHSFSCLSDWWPAVHWQTGWVSVWLIEELTTQCVGCKKSVNLSCALCFHYYLASMAQLNHMQYCQHHNKKLSCFKTQLW